MKSRLAMLAVVCIAAFAGAASTAGAQHTTTLTGTFDVEGFFELGSHGCSFVYQELDGTLTVQLGTGALHLAFCTDDEAPAFPPFPVSSGTFAITSGIGDLTGDVGGYLLDAIAPATQPAHLVLTVTGGTGQLTGATGEIVLDGLATFDVQPGNLRMRVTGDVSGKIRVPRVPASKDDCKHGGWRHYTDEHGQPFRNQGLCVSWVNGRR